LIVDPSVSPVVSGNIISYPQIFKDLAVRYTCGNASLKEEIVLSQEARNSLPDPTKYGLSRNNSYFVVAMEFLLTPNNINVFARRQGNKTPIKQGNNFNFDGDDPIEFEDENTTLHFFFPKDYAHAVGDSITGFSNRVNLRRYFYSQAGKHYMLVGVPWSWINSAPQGTLIIDPTTSVGASDDVWLEDNATGLGSSTQVIIGKAASYPKKRTIIKFNTSGVPTNATVLNAQMKLYYYTAVRVGTTAWVDRWVQAHQVLVNWNEAEATDDYRLTSTLWNVNYVGLNDIDAKSGYESTTLFQQDYPKWKQWDITALTQKWVNLTATNYGVVLWATNETTDGYDLRFYSSEYTMDPALQPKLEITYSTEAKTVYFLKDHLGSTRATVLDSATAPVIGYDDYDSWGYPLALRTKPIPNAYLQGASKNKFTGQMWDDDYGLNWYHLGARPYDSQIGRIPVVDRFADKYPSLNPYHYAADNPVLFIDANGDTSDYSALNKEQRKSFDQLIVTLSKDKRFAEVWNTLATSTGIYKITVNKSQKNFALYDPNTEKTGSGGTLSFREISSGIEGTTAHEVYHAFQHDQRYPPRSVGKEIEASLFADAVTNTALGFTATPLFINRIPIFQKSYENLLFGESFSENDWIMAITTFKKGGLMSSRYNNLNIQVYNPLIKRFYPLLR